MYKCNKCANVPSPTTYPSTPEELGTEFMSYAYDSDDPPMKKDMKHLADLIANHTPVRNTSALLRSDAPDKILGFHINPDVVNTLKAIGLKIASPDKNTFYFHASIFASNSPNYVPGYVPDYVPGTSQVMFKPPPQ